MARWGPRGRASDIFAYPSRHGGAREGRERERERERERGVPGGHALSLYNVVSFEKFPSRKNSPPETSGVPRAINFACPAQGGGAPPRRTLLTASVF